MRKNHKKAGFTLVEIMIVVAIIGLLAAIAIPSFVKARTSSQTNACINNLRQIDGAKDQWAIEYQQAPTATPGTSDIDEYLKGGTANISCPADAADGFGSSYTIGDLKTTPTCRIDTTHVY